MLLTRAPAAVSSSTVVADGCLVTTVSEISVVLGLPSDEIPDSSLMLLLDECEVSPIYFGALYKFVS